jgi:alcohol dehydrogenase class IV
MWYFNSPEVVFGEGALDYLDHLSGKRAFIVTDPVLHQLGFTERVAEHLRRAGMEVSCFAEVEPEPSLQTVRRGAEVMRAFEPDWIVGLGGGSAMDAAKAMWVLYECPDTELAAINPWQPLELGVKARLITIPTTSGTGSEVTWYVVLTDTEEGRKVGVGTRDMLATVAIVDPALTMDLPARTTADTGIDALTHAIEGYSCNWSNDFSEGPCLKAVQLIFKYLPRAVADGQDAEARTKMANAAALGGLGFGNAMAALAHVMGHAFGTVFHQAHGRSVGLYLPYTTTYSANVFPDRYAEIAHFLRLDFADAAAGVTALVEAIRSLMREVGQPTTVAEMGIARDDYEREIEHLCDLSENDTQLVAVPRMPTREELAELFRCAYDGKAVEI